MVMKMPGQILRKIVKLIGMLVFSLQTAFMVKCGLASAAMTVTNSQEIPLSPSMNTLRSYQIRFVRDSATIFLLLFLSIPVTSTHAVAQANAAYTDRLLQLEFPTASDWSPTNSYGVLKWMQPFTYAVRSESSYESTVLKMDLAGMLQQLPASAKTLAHEGNAPTDQDQEDTVDVLIWITSTPWEDCRGPLLPFLRKISPPEENIEATVSRREAAGDNALVKFGFDSAGALTGAILVIDAQATSDVQKLDVVRRFLLASMSPRLFSIDGEPPFALTANGEIELSILVRQLFSAVYDPDIESGASEAQLRAVIQKKIEQGAFGP